MKENKMGWEWFLFTFGLFMIMAAPGIGSYPQMIISGVFFSSLSVALMAYRKRKRK